VTTGHLYTTYNELHTKLL